MEGWAKFHRKIFQWEWYTDANTFRLFFHLVLNANHKDARWQGVEIKRGQLITSHEHLAKELKLTRQQIRTSINRLKSTNEITIKSTNKYTLVTIEKYNDYQSFDEELTSKTTNNLTNEQPATNQQLTTNKNDKNKKNENNKDIYAEVEAVLSYYDSLENLPKYKSLTTIRKSHVKARLYDYGIEEVKRTLKLANESKYLNSGNKWFNFDWIFKPSNFVKISEGRYNEDEEELDNVADITQYRYQTPEQRYQNHINSLKYDNSDNPFVNRRANNE